MTLCMLKSESLDRQNVGVVCSYNAKQTQSGTTINRIKGIRERLEEQHPNAVAFIILFLWWHEWMVESPGHAQDKVKDVFPVVSMFCSV